eukprot:6492348-Amphidinium_carterae.1
MTRFAASMLAPHLSEVTHELPAIIRDPRLFGATFRAGLGLFYSISKGVHHTLHGTIRTNIVRNN